MQPVCDKRIVNPDAQYVVESGLALLLQYCTITVLRQRPTDPVMTLVQLLRQGYMVLPTTRELSLFLRSATKVDPMFLLKTLRASFGPYFTYCAPKYHALCACVEETADVLCNLYKENITALQSGLEVNRTTYPVALHAACHLGLAKWRAHQATTPQLFMFVMLLRNGDAKRLLSPSEPSFLQRKVAQVEWLMKACPIGSAYKFFVVDEFPITDTLDVPNSGRTAERLAMEWHPKGSDAIEILYVKSGASALATGIAAANAHWQTSGVAIADAFLWVDRDTYASVHLGEMGHAMAAMAMPEIAPAPPVPEVSKERRPPGELQKSSGPTGDKELQSNMSPPAKSQGRGQTTVEKEVKKAAPPVVPVTTCAAVFSRRHPQSFVTLHIDEAFQNTVHRMPEAGAIANLCHCCCPWPSSFHLLSAFGLGPATCYIASAAPAQKYPRCRVLLRTGCPAVGCFDISMLWECVGHGPSCLLGAGSNASAIACFIGWHAKEHFDVTFGMEVCLVSRFGSRHGPRLARLSHVQSDRCVVFGPVRV